MSFRIVHFAPDDKFIPLQQELFEAALPCSNSFRILAKGHLDFSFTKETKGTVAIEKNYFSSPAAKADFAECDCVVFHSMNETFAQAFPLIAQDTLVVWSAWGFEYFHLIEERYGRALLDSTQRHWQGMVRRKRMRMALTPGGWGVLIRNLSRKVRGKSGAHAGLVAVAPRLDAFSINPADAPRIRAVLTDLNAKSHLLPYITTEDTLEKGPEIMAGPDILLGNSATLTNNHIEALHELRKIDLSGRRIITPLSYGDMDYADHVSRVGTDFFGTCFVPLRDFVSLEEYGRRIRGCGTVIMNHVRQQAVGNISAALYKGAQVYLRPENPLFGFFRGLGANISSVVELAENERDPSGRDEATFNASRRAVGDYWARSRAISQIRLLPQLRQEKNSATCGTQEARRD